MTKGKQLTASAVARALRRAGIVKYAPKCGGLYVNGQERVLGSLSGYSVRQSDFRGRSVDVWAHGSAADNNGLENFMRILKEAGFNVSHNNDWQGRPLACLTVTPEVES